MFAQRKAEHSLARITRALNDAGISCPSASYAVAARARSWSGAPFTKQRTTSVPLSSRIRWKVAISL